VWETKSLATLQLASFGVSAECRAQIAAELRLFIAKAFVMEKPAPKALELHQSAVPTPALPKPIKVYPFLVSLHRSISSLLLRPEVAAEIVKSTASLRADDSMQLARRRSASVSSLKSLATVASESELSAAQSRSHIGPLPDGHTRPPFASMLQNTMRRARWEFRPAAVQTAHTLLAELQQQRRSEGFICAFSDTNSCLMFREVALAALDDATSSLGADQLGASRTGRAVNRTLLQCLISLKQNAALRECTVRTELFAEALSGHYLVQQALQTVLPVDAATTFAAIASELLARDWHLAMMLSSFDALKPFHFSAPPSPSRSLTPVRSASVSSFFSSSIWTQQREFWKAHEKQLRPSDAQHLDAPSALLPASSESHWGDEGMFVCLSDPVSSFCSTPGASASFNAGFQNHLPASTFASANTGYDSDSDSEDAGETLAVTSCLPFDICSLFGVSSPSHVALKLVSPCHSISHENSTSLAETSGIHWNEATTVTVPDRMSLRISTLCTGGLHSDGADSNRVWDRKLQSAIWAHEMIVFCAKKLSDMEIVPGHVYARSLASGSVAIVALPRHPLVALPPVPTGGTSEQEPTDFEQYVVSTRAHTLASSLCGQYEQLGREFLYAVLDGSRQQLAPVTNAAEGKTLWPSCFVHSCAASDSVDCTSILCFEVSRTDIARGLRERLQSSTDHSQSAQYWMQCQPRIVSLDTRNHLSDSARDSLLWQFFHSPSLAMRNAPELALDAKHRFVPAIACDVHAQPATPASASSVDSCSALRSLFADEHEKNFPTMVYLNLLAEIPVRRDDVAAALQSCCEYAFEVDATMLSRLDPDCFSDAAGLGGRVSSLLLEQFRRIENTDDCYYYCPRDANANANARGGIDEFERVMGLAFFKLLGAPLSSQSIDPAHDAAQADEEDEFGPRWSIAMASEFTDRETFETDGARSEASGANEFGFAPAPRRAEPARSVAHTANADGVAQAVWTWSPSQALDASATLRPIFVRVERVDEGGAVSAPAPPAVFPARHAPLAAASAAGSSHDSQHSGFPFAATAEQLRVVEVRMENNQSFVDFVSAPGASASSLHQSAVEGSLSTKTDDSAPAIDYRSMLRPTFSATRIRLVLLTPPLQS
jgi:hypothetical protein